MASNYLVNSSATPVTLANPLNIDDNAGFTSASGLTLHRRDHLDRDGLRRPRPALLGARSNVTFAGAITGGSNGLTVRQGSVTVSGANTYTGDDHFRRHADRGRQRPQRQHRRLRQRRQCADDRRQQLRRQYGRAGGWRSLHDRPSDHGQHHRRQRDLGNAHRSGTSTFSGALTLNDTSGVTLSTAAGGTVLFSGNIRGREPARSRSPLPATSSQR